MDVKTIKLKKTILEDNDKDADLLREQLLDDGTFYINIMSSPGSGKTTTLVSTINRLAEATELAGVRPLEIGVMEADIDSDVDAHTIIEKTGASSVQLHTGGMCHLDADMSRQGLREIDSENLDLVFLENVGNLVCPAEFDTGAAENVVILSVPEGDDKPLKYPLMFTEADAVIVNKIDAMPAFDFDKDRFRENLKTCNEDAPVFFISAATGEGIDQWCAWILDEMDAWRQE
ncbi:MAG: hydrogenase nickel incorporation protein HypB [Bacillota bacterium]|nr:hydrogenase nickel incorporation protein HypB [Bacillota bacterium]